MERLNGLSNPVTNKTNDILKKLDNIYGVENYKDTIRRYAEYLSLKKENLIKIGNVNVLIKSENEMAETEKLIELIYSLLKNNKLISGFYKKLTSSDIKDNKSIEKMEEQLLIIETNSLTNSVREDIYNRIEENKDKIFILVDKTSTEWVSNEISNEIITWQIKVTDPTKEENRRKI